MFHLNQIKPDSRADGDKSLCRSIDRTGQHVVLFTCLMLFALHV